jgi:CheY-like chemotaxis protein
MLAADGKDALNVYLKNRKAIDLVILDISMPALSGPEVLYQIRNIVPEAKVILSSGYSDGAGDQMFPKLKPSAFVSKPYRPADLARVVRQVLDRQSQAA